MVDLNRSIKSVYNSFVRVDAFIFLTSLLMFMQCVVCINDNSVIFQLY